MTAGPPSAESAFCWRGRILPIEALWPDDLHHAAPEPLPDALSVPRPDDGWFRRVGRTLGSLWEVFGDTPTAAARRTLGETPRRAVCRHYAGAVRTLFHAAKRATGRQDAYLPALVGGLDASAGAGELGHAWNLLADLAHGRVYALDVAWADQLHDDGRAPVFAPGYANLGRHRHVSSLLATLLIGYGMDGSALYRAPEVVETLGALVDPHAERGLRLLFHLGTNPAIDPRARERIVRHLDRSGFDRVIPNWRPQLSGRGARSVPDDDEDLLPFERLGLGP